MSLAAEGAGEGYSDQPVSYYAFDIPADSDWLTLQIEYERHGLWVQYYLWDPEGNLRYQHLDWQNPRKAVISGHAGATSYLGVPGRIPVGKWRIEFYNPTYSFHVEWRAGNGALPEEAAGSGGNRRSWTDAHDARGAFVLNRYDWTADLKARAGWYKGDLHVHSMLSDGRVTPEELTRKAAAAGLDFFAITDHNVLSTAWPKDWEEQLLVIPGVEVTSVCGHCNLIGLRQWVDWRSGTPDAGMNSEEGMARIWAEAAAAGAIRSINHGLVDKWQWKLKWTRLADIDTLEIINYPSLEANRQGNEKNLILWNALWNEGYRIYGIGGSDTHAVPGETDIGEPATYVWAEKLSPAAIMAGIRAGRVYVSLGSTLTCDVVVDGAEYLPGSDLTAVVAASPDGRVVFRACLDTPAEGTLNWIENGAIVASEKISPDRNSYELVRVWKERPYAWGRLEVRGSGGELLAFTNPVYCGSAAPSIHTWEELLRKCGMPTEFGTA